MKKKQAHYCFKQQAGSNVHQLYIYDDVEEYGDFDWWTWEYKESETSAKYFKKALAEIPETDTIELHINSYGGSVKEGVAIYNLLKQKKCKEIVAYVDGFAYSIASIILQAADRRIMGLGTSLLIHNMWITTAGNANDLRKAAEDLDVLMESNRQIYLERANISEEELIELLDNETYLTPEKAVEMGFADEIDSKKETNADDSLQAMQQQLQQMRRVMTEQKAFRTELLELCKGIKQKDTDEEDTDEEDTDKEDTDEGDAEDENTDDADDENTDEDDTDDEENRDDKGKEAQKAKQYQNKSHLASLVAKAAKRNLEKER